MKNNDETGKYESKKKLIFCHYSLIKPRTIQIAADTQFSFKRIPTKENLPFTISKDTELHKQSYMINFPNLIEKINE